MTVGEGRAQTGGGGGTAARERRREKSDPPTARGEGQTTGSGRKGGGGRDKRGGGKSPGIKKTRHYSGGTGTTCRAPTQRVPAAGPRAELSPSRRALSGSRHRAPRKSIGKRRWAPETRPQSLPDESPGSAFPSRGEPLNTPSAQSAHTL